MSKKEENSIVKKVPKDDIIYELSELFKVFGDSTRTKILIYLSIENMTVSEIAKTTNMSISAVSHQLRVLKNTKLVRGIKKGKEVKYQLEDSHVVNIINCGIEHLKERK